jgi:hypothetical protein
MKKIKFIIPLVALLFASCDNYLDINDNPNNAPGESIEPRHILPGAQLNAFRVQAGSMNQLGNVFMNSWSGNVNSFTGGFSREFQLTIDNAFYNGIWDGLFLACKNFEDLSKYPNPNGKYDYYVAAGKIMKAYYMQYLVDLYGDIPYDEAFKGQNNITPRYNDDQYVYRQLIKELEDARDLIGNATNADTMGAEDIMFGGDTAKWTSFANTVELKMLMRMSNSTGAVATYRDLKLADVAAYDDFSTEDVTINPGFSDATDSQMNPFINTYLIDAAGTRQTNYTFICASNHQARFMNGATTEMSTGSGQFYPGVIDLRRGRMWRLSSGVVKGVTQGATSGTPEASNPVSFMGITAINPYIQQPSVVGFPSSASQYYYFLPLSSNDGYVMTLSEVEFLRSEAAVRFPSLFSDAQTHFNAGIQASYDYHFLTAANLSSYMSAIASKAGLGWTASTTDDLKIRAIMTQKWIALTDVNGVESFIDYNRTGYPYTPLALTAGQTRKPRRLIYPVSEYVANSANVPNITTTQIFATTDPSHPFWMLGNPVLGN